jgi:hypothetical protein
MSKYIFEGSEFTLEEIQGAAAAKNMSVEEYLAANPEIQVIEDIATEPDVQDQQEFEDPFLQSVKKTMGPVEEAAAVGPEVTAEQPDTGLVSEDISLDSPDPRYIEFNIKGEKTYSSYGDIQKEHGDVETWVKSWNNKTNTATAKIITPPKQLEEAVVTGDAEKIVDPGEYLTEVIEADTNFFSRAPDQIQADLEMQFPDIEFSSTVRTGSTMSAGRRVIKAKKDGKEIKLFTDITTPRQTNSFYTDNLKNLKKFLSETYKPEEVKRTKERIEVAETEALDILQPLAAEAKQSENYQNFDNEDLFEPYTKKVEATSFVGGMPTGGGYETEVRPYEARLKNAYNKLKKISPEKTEEQLKKDAENTVRDELKNEYVFNEVSEQIQDKIASIGNKGIRANLQAFLNTGYLSSNFKSKIYLNKIELEKEASGIFSKILEGESVTQQETDQFVNILKKLDIDVNTDLTKKVVLPSGSVVSEAFIDGALKFQTAAQANEILYLQSQEEMNKKASEIKNVQAALNATQRDYNIGRKAMTSVGVGVGDIGVGITYLGGKVISVPFYLLGQYKDMNQALDSFAVKYNEVTNEIRESYVKDVAFDDAFKENNFGKFALQEVSNQLPIIASIMASGGAAAYVIGSSSAGKQMMDMQTEIASGSAEYTNSEVWLKSLGFGVAEAAFAQLTTIPILNRAKSTLLRGNPKANSIIDNSTAAYAKSGYKGVISDTLLESIGEVATVGTQNLLLGNPFVEGMDHAGFSGAGFGLLFSGIPFMRGLHLSRYSDYSKLKKVREIQAEINGLSLEYNGAKNEGEKARIEEQIKKLSVDAANEIQLQEKNINEHITARAGQYVIDITNRQAKIQLEAKAILADNSLTESQKGARLQQLQAETDYLQSSKEGALKDSAKVNKFTEFLLLKGSNEAQYNQYLNDAQALLSADKTAASEEKIQSKALELYFQDQIVAENNKANKRLGANFKSFNTVKEATAFIQNSKTISDPDKKTLIQNLKDGDDGAAYVSPEGKKTTYAVVENQVRNQRKFIRTHEVGHQVFWDILGTDPAAFDEIGRQLLETTKVISPSIHKQLLKEEGDGVEIVARFLERVAAGDVDFRNNNAKKAMSGLFGTIVQKKFGNEYDFNFAGETDMFNFIVGIGKKIADGSLTTADIKKAKGSEVVKQIKDTSIVLPTKQEQTRLKRAASTKKELSDVFPEDMDSTEAYFTVTNTKALDGSIINAAKAAGIPTDRLDVEAIKENIGIRLIKNYDPDKNTVFGYLLGSRGIVRAAVLDQAKAFKETVTDTAKSLDVQAGDLGSVAEIAAEEVSIEEREAREAEEEAEVASTFNLTTSSALLPATVSKAKDKVLGIVRTLKNKLGAAVSKNVNTVPVVKEVIQSSARSIDIDIKKQIGGKADLKLRKWTIDNKADIINNTSATWLMGKDSGTTVKGGIPIAIEKSVGGKYTGKTIEINVGGKIVKVQEFKPNFVPYPEWVGQKIDREKTVERGQTSGNEIVRKVKPAKISNNAFADFVTTEDGTPIRGRKESLSQELASRLGGQIFREEMLNAESDISKAFEQNQDLRGAVLSDNFRNEIIEQTERGLIARSAGMAVESAIGAMTRATNTERAEALQKIKSLLSAKEYQTLYDTEIGPFLDVMEEIDEGGWYVAEQKAIDVFNELQKIVSNLKITQTEPIGDPSSPDVIFEYEGVPINWEIKKGKNARLSQMYISDWSTDSPGISRNVKQEYKDQILEAEKNNKGLKKYIDQLTNGKYSDKITFDGKKWIMPKNVYYALQRLGFQKNATTKLTLPTDIVSQLYKEKNTHYIGFTDIGNFSLDSNPMGLNLPPFLGEVDINVKFKPNFRKDGTVSVSRVAYPSLTTQTASDLAKTSTSSVYSTGSMKNLFESINKGTIAASKGKPVSDVLKKQYEQQQDYLISLTKGELDKKDTFDMRQVIARQMFPKQALSDTVMAGKTDSFSILTDAQKKKVLSKVPGMIARSEKRKVNLNSEFNKMIERASGIPARKKLSGVVARRIGTDKGMFKLFLPPSAEDLRGLYYSLLGSGRQGEADKEFFKDHVVAPYTRGIAAMEKAKQAIMNDFKALRKIFRPDLKAAGIKSMNQKVPGMDISVDQAVRIYLWTQSDKTIPELTEADQKKAVEYIYKTPILQAYANGLLAISKQDSWSDPTEYWDAQTTLSDLTDIALNVNRKFYLKEFIENTEQIFSNDNLNKLEATLGKSARQSFEDILYRMRTGSNKPSGGDSIVNKWNNWVNNSVGAIMFFNRRSATLQLLSTVNFLNYTDNHPLRAAAAFANFPQYMKDWTTIFNSPKLKERRGGLKSDVQEAEIAAAAKNANNKPLAMISYLLKIGFTPTKIADSFAIATGGAAFYRNRINTYKKKGFDDAESEAKAWEDFSNISDETQQSGDPMLISKQQAGAMGRLILAFQNTPMQITRFQKRDFQDIINRRRIKGKSQFQSDMTYLSRITYYTAIQNLIFSTLQNGLFTLLPGFDDEDEENLTAEELEKIERKEEQKVKNVLNSMLDTTLRGSGLYGAVASTIKNVLIEYMRQQEKDPFQKDNAKILLQAINISPPIGSKARKFYSSLEAMDYERDVLETRGFGVMIDGKFQLSPAYQVLGNLSSAAINLPLDRAVTEINAVTEALDSRNSDMQRIAMALGWKSWEVGAEIEEHELINTTAKETRALEATRKRKEQSAAKRQKEIDAIQAMSQEEINAYANWKSKPENKGKRLLNYLEENK